MTARRGTAPHPILTYGLAVLLCAAIFGLRQAFRSPDVDRLVFIPFMPAIVVAAAWGGLGPGLVATLLGSALAGTAFLGPNPTATFTEPGRLLGIVIFVFSGVAVSWVCETFHTSIAELTYNFAFKARLAPDGRLALDAVSDGFERLLGLRLDELPSPDAWAPLVHSDHLERLAVNLQRLAQGEVVEDELRAVPRDGRELWVRYRIRPVRRTDGALEVFGAVEDVTERRRAAAEAERLLEQLHIVTDSMGAAVAQCSRDMRYVWASPAYLAWRGVSEDRVVGRPIEEVLGPAAFRALLPHFQRVLAGETVEYEALIEVAGLGPRWLHAIYSPVPGPSGGIEGWVAVVMDVTQRHRAEFDLREADRRKDEFIAILAHELRNPLAPVLSALEILRREGSDPALRTQAVAMMTRQVQQMVRLIDDLLDVARLTRGTLELRRVRMDLVSALDGAIETTRSLIERSGHVLTTEIPAGPFPIHGDPVRLAQVFANLLNNAARYSDAGGPIVLGVERDGAQARVTVRDEGIGIPAEALPGIFEMFSRVDSRLTRTRGGLGVGLGLVRRLVEMHGGTVAAHSAGPGRGSTFTVALPLATAPAPAESPLPGASVDHANGARRVLVVDDNEDAAVSLAALLRLSGHHARTVHEPFETLAVAEADRPDVILLDIGMPGLDGYQLARRIRSQPWGRDIVLVAVTGWGREEDRERSRDEGFDRHLVKPVDTETLTALLDSLPPAPVPSGTASAGD
jgi:PAS domain S-box-containing protein